MNKRTGKSSFFIVHLVEFDKNHKLDRNTYFSAIRRLNNSSAKHETTIDIYFTVLVAAQIK
jgi:hypothetical protein